jgi:tight adherence protein B
MGILLILAFVVGVAIVMGVYMTLAKVPEMMAQKRLDQRLSELSETPETDEEKKKKVLVKVQHEGPLPALDRLASTNARVFSVAAWIEQSGVKMSFSAFLLASVACGLVMMVIVTAIARASWGFPTGFLIGMTFPAGVLKFKRGKRLNAFEEQFPEALDLIARALKAGHAFATGLKMVADEMADPVGPEFRKTFDEQNFGLPLKDALDNLSRRIPVLDVRFFSTAVLIQRETGGNLSEILENLAHVVRERFKILRQVRVYTAHGRLTGYVLLALPAALSIALMFINPEHMNLLFRERMGQMMLMTALGMQTAGYLWIRQIVKIEV